MNVDVYREISIARPPEAVASFAMEAENDTRWIGGISEVRRLTEPPTGVGTRVQRVASFLGRRIDYVMEVVEHEPPARVVLRSIQSPFPMRVGYEFAPEGSGTLARIRVSGSVSGLYKLAAPALERAVGRSLARDLRNLRGLLESEADAARPVSEARGAGDRRRRP
jgi:carbon monoxide dehydrogenase subunit G